VLIKFPRIVPSTFETEAGRAKRYGIMSRKRAKAVVTVLTHIDEEMFKAPGMWRANPRKQAELHASVAKQILMGSSEFASLRPLTPYVLPDEAAATPRKQRQQQRKCLDGVPAPLLNAACGVIGIGTPAVFGWRRGALFKHLAALHAEDTALAAGGMRELSEAQLREACFDRGMGAKGASSGEMRRQLQQWLEISDQLVMMQGKTVEPQPLRMRLAALAAFGVSTTRRAQDCELERSLYA